jgi:hypothetical protein
VSKLPRFTEGDPNKPRAVHQWKDWVEYGTTPSLLYPAYNCDCCTLDPTGLIQQSRVDTGETTTVSGSGTAFYPAMFTDEWGDPGEAQIPRVDFNWGAVSAAFAYYPSGTMSPPEGFTLDGNDLNAYPVLELSATIGGELLPQYWELGEGVPTAVTVTGSCSYGARLFATIEELTRYNSAPIWGPRPTWGETKEAIDLRGYKSAMLDWWYWPADGCEVTISACGQTLTVTSGGVPTVVLHGSATMTNIEPRRYTELFEVWIPATLEFEFFGSQALPESSTTYWYDEDETNGATCSTSGNTVSLVVEGTIPAANFRKATLSRNDVQPPRSITIIGEAVAPHPFSIPDGTYSAIPYDGPTTLGAVEYSCNTEYPIGTAIGNIPFPGTWEGTGETYLYTASGFFDAPAVAAIIAQDTGDTIGTNPAFGFVLDQSGADTASGSGDNWRFPLRIPADRATWLAGQIRRRRTPVMPAETGWSAGNESTTVTTSGGIAHVEGTGTLLASQEFGLDWHFNDFRYLILPIRATEADQALTVTCGSKTWDLTLSSAAIPAVEYILDLCCPTNAAGVDDTTTNVEVRSAQGGWSWGLEQPVTITISSSLPFWVSPVRLGYAETPGILAIGESLARFDERFKTGTATVYEGGIWEHEVDIYAQRGLLFAPEGRVLYDEEMGLIGDGYNTAIFPAEYLPHLVLSIEDVINAATLRQADTDYALVSMANMAPRQYQRLAIGDFVWSPHDWYFNNYVEAYHLRPVFEVVDTEVVIPIYADYCVDRIAPGVGVTCFLTVRKMITGGLFGITADAGVATPMTVGVDSPSQATLSGETGLFVLPSTNLLTSNAKADITGDWQGSPSQDVVEGTLTRVGVIADS